MKPTLALLLGLVLAGCVPTADFTDLRADVRQLQAENRKLKERLENQDQGVKPADVAKKLEVLEARIESLRLTQQGFDQQLGPLLREADEAAWRREQAGGREEVSAKPGGPAAAKSPRGDASAGPPPKAGAPDSQAAPAPTDLFNKAYSGYLKVHYDLAVSDFEGFLKKYPSTSLAADAQYWIGRSHYNKKDYRPAVEAYERAITEYPKSDKAPAALFEAGLAHAELGDILKAKERLRQVIDKYPQSNEASRARLKLLDLK